MKLSARPFGLLSTKSATRARWAEGRPAIDKKHRRSDVLSQVSSKVYLPPYELIGS